MLCERKTNMSYRILDKIGQSCYSSKTSLGNFSRLTNLLFQGKILQIAANLPNVEVDDGINQIINSKDYKKIVSGYLALPVTKTSLSAKT